MKNPDDTKEAFQQNVVQPSHKQPYEPPMATFVPLKVEERLLGCGKPYSPCSPPAAS